MIGLPSMHVAKMTKPKHPFIHDLSIQGCLLRTSLWLAIIWHGTIIRTLSAESPSAISWTFETLPEAVCKHNKELAAAHWVIEFAKARSQQAGKLANPRASTTSGINTITSENMQGFSLQQSFPITARLRLEKKWHPWIFNRQKRKFNGWRTRKSWKPWRLPRVGWRSESVNKS